MKGIMKNLKQLTIFNHCM